MAKFDVYLYYHGCFSTEVEAETEEKALEIARTQVMNMSDTEFVGGDGADIFEEGHDVIKTK